MGKRIDPLQMPAELKKIKNLSEDINYYVLIKF